MIVLGIDPGVASTGYAVIEHRANSSKLITAGVIRTKSGQLLSTRLEQIAKLFKEILDEHEVDQVAIERLFFSKNVTNGIEVGHARGVILYLSAAAGLSCFEYRPSEVKQAITGVGNATKEQMGKMVSKILKLKSVPKSDDLNDAVAVALTHVFNLPYIAATKTKPARI